MEKRNKRIIIFFLVLPVILFLVISFVHLLSQMASAGGCPGIGFPFKFSSGGSGSTLNPNFCDYFSFWALIGDVLIVYLLSGALYFLFRKRN
jgi:formate/nitrite transporter FocA (FNT family)